MWKQFRVPLAHKSIGHFIQSLHPYDDEGEHLSVAGMMAHIECLYDFKRTIPPEYRFSRALYVPAHWGRRVFSCAEDEALANSSEPIIDFDAFDKITYGVGPEDVRLGDKVCVLQGCTVAVILRKVGD